MENAKKKPGRPAAPPNRLRSGGLHLRVSPDDIAELDAVCEAAKLGRAALLRRLVSSEALRLGIVKDDANASSVE
jgi:hypothetical protein